MNISYFIQEPRTDRYHVVLKNATQSIYFYFQAQNQRFAWTHLIQNVMFTYLSIEVCHRFLLFLFFQIYPFFTMLYYYIILTFFRITLKFTRKTYATLWSHGNLQILKLKRLEISFLRGKHFLKKSLYTRDTYFGFILTIFLFTFNYFSFFLELLIRIL